jgi:antibiotic biosynthesis monooxygenase (ABM) superfamily enzyme
LPGAEAAGKLPGVAAIEEPEARARAGERVARTDPVTAVFSRRVNRFRAWIESDERNRWLGEVGLETWFDLPGPNGAPQRPPPRWKMWLVSLLAVSLLRRLLGRSPEAW